MARADRNDLHKSHIESQRNQREERSARVPEDGRSASPTGPWP